MKTSGCIFVILGLAMGWTISSAAQTTPPATAAPPPDILRDFSGTWTLDRSLSNDPAQANFDAGSRQQPNQGTGRRRGGLGGFGGFGRGGGSGNRDNGNGTPDERARLASLTDQLRKASATLIISHHDPSFVINDAQDHTLFFQTNASRDDHTLGAVTITSSTRWEGDRIVTEYAISSRRTLVYTYTLLPKSMQMVLRVRPQFNDVSSASASELKLVYSLSPSQDR